MLTEGKDALTIADDPDEELQIIEEIVAAVSSCEADATPEDVYEKLRGNQEIELTAV